MYTVHILAAMAMQSLLVVYAKQGVYDEEKVAKEAYDIAEAMIEESNKRDGRGDYAKVE